MSNDANSCKIDVSFSKLGYSKTMDNEKYVRYQKFDSIENDVHHIDIVKNKGGRCVIQSYGKNVEHNGDWISVMWGMTLTEITLAFEKAVAKGWA